MRNLIKKQAGNVAVAERNHIPRENEVAHHSNYVDPTPSQNILCPAPTKLYSVHGPKHATFLFTDARMLPTTRLSQILAMYFPTHVCGHKSEKNYVFVQTCLHWTIAPLISANMASPIAHLKNKRKASCIRARRSGWNLATLPFLRALLPLRQNSRYTTKWHTPFPC